MSSLIRITKKCAVCGCEHTFTVVKSTNSFGHMDLDTRPAGMERSILPYEIQYCEHCHYANSDISEKPAWFDEKVLSSNAYLAVVNNSALDPVAKSFLLSGYLNAAGGQFKEAGILSLKAAWIFDDKNENQNAMRARSKATKYLLNYVSQIEDINIATMVVDINRRMGEFDAAKEAAVQLLGFGATGLIEKILQYEISLIDAKDTACHTVGEIKGI